MAFSAIPLRCLLVTLSTATILFAEGQVPVSTIEPGNRGTTTEAVGASGNIATALNDVTPPTAAQSDDVTTEPPSTTFTSALRFKSLPNPTATPLQLVCPNSNPHHFLETSWLILTAEDIMYRLYRISQQGDVSKYKDWSSTLSGMKVAHNLTSADSLMIYHDTCNRSATYQCRRSARVGYTDEVHSFSVCQLYRREERRHWNPC
jgi:hypothetical protein